MEEGEIEGPNNMKGRKNNRKFKWDRKIRNVERTHRIKFVTYYLQSVLLLCMLY
jgi:hypothetical protein